MRDRSGRVLPTTEQVFEAPSLASLTDTEKMQLIEIANDVAERIEQLNIA